LVRQFSSSQDQEAATWLVNLIQGTIIKWNAMSFIVMAVQQKLKPFNRNFYWVARSDSGQERH
jgi:hypothetical protein